MAPLIADLLRRRARTLGAQPLVTLYDLATGERTELSATSFLNWVDKTSNLLADELLLGPGSVVDLQLAIAAPGHWMTFVLELACWQVGAAARVSASPAAADLLVLGPDWEEHDRSRADTTLACSLHPLGLGFAAALPPAVIDFALEVRGQADHHLAVPLLGTEVAWTDDQRQLTQAELVRVDHEHAARRLVVSSDPWSSVQQGLLRPLLTGGSAVVVVGDDPVRLARIAETERADDSPSGSELLLAFGVLRLVRHRHRHR